MIFSGLKFRSLQQRNDYSFSIQASINNTTGTSLFYFSGTGAAGATKYLSFDFVSGRIIDPAGRFVHNYYENEDFTISGNVKSNEYNYYINDTPFVLSGDKDSFPVRRFFVDATGCKLDVSNLNIQVSGSGNLFLSGFDDSRGVGDNQTVTGTVVHSGTGENFNVLSGEVTDGSVTGLFRYDPNDFTKKYPQNIPLSGSKAGLILSGISGIEADIPYSVPTRIWTDFGAVEQTITVTGRERIEYSFFTLPMMGSDNGNDFVTAETGVVSGDWPQKEKTGDFVAKENLYTGGAYHASGLPIRVSLFHYAGYTGTVVNAVTGTSGTTAGALYYGDTAVVVSGGGGTGARASGFADTEIRGNFSGVRIYDGGSGYTSTPSIVVYSGLGEVKVRNSGTGYFSPFPIYFTGGLEGGNAASGYCEVDSDNGFVTDFVIDDRGTGYYQIPSFVTLAPGISGIKLTNSGSGYVSTPVITVTGGGGTGASVEAMMSYVITGINLISSGSGYDATPVVNFHGKNGGGTGAFIRAQMTNYSVSGIAVTNGGSGYTTLPTVILSGYGGGTGAAAVAQFGYSITGIHLTSSGSGYSGVPTVLFSGGGGINNGIGGASNPTVGYSTASATALTGQQYSDHTGVTGFTIVNGGTGFSSVPSIIVSGGYDLTYGGYAASGTALTGDPVLTGFNVISGGSGYSTGFYPLISGGGILAGGHSGTGYVSIDNGLRGSGFVTGFEIVSGGSEFTGQFNLNISGGFTFATPLESVYGCSACTFYPATGLVSNASGLGSGFITGFRLEPGVNYPSGGSGYTSTPGFTMSGGSGRVSDFLSGSGEIVMPTGFSGDIFMSHNMSTNALVGSYTKDWTGQWNLLTGSGGDYYNYRDNGCISGTGLGYTGTIYYFKSNGSDIGVEDELNIRVTNINYWDNLVSVARLTVSGSGNLMKHQLISGVR